MKKKFSLFAISIFMLGTASSVNAETRSTERVCEGVTFSCGKKGQVCDENAERLTQFIDELEDIVCK